MDMDNIETLIGRAMMALGAGVSEREIVDRLSEEDTSEGQVFFALKAAEILLKDKNDG